MVNVAEQLDEINERVMSGLKDFQRATVDRIYHLYETGQRRVLVSDEVGLGKTLIARGTVARVAKLRQQEGDDLFKVVYICSNGAIADQNLQKLRITNEVRTEKVSSSRLSMQHLHIFNQESDTELLHRYIQLIPLTPDTSFRMTAGTGTVGERALMFAILRRLPELAYYLPELEVAMKDWAYTAWAGYRDWYEKCVVQCDEKTGGKYLDYMRTELRKELRNPWRDGLNHVQGIVRLCGKIRDNGGKRVGETGIISSLRIIFARISLQRLQPDLVIMDEFQRFRDLLVSDPDSEIHMLADKFFHAENVRMLLLSATPYKMYSTLEEIDAAHVDEHYSEFLTVMDFLNENSASKEHFRTVWHDYSVRLKELTLGDTTILAAKDAAEDAMYHAVCRTERITEKENADIIDDSSTEKPVDVAEEDVASYLQAQSLIDSIGLHEHVPVDYIKSTPYLMSFMRDYKLKREVEKYFRKNPGETGKINKDIFWLKRRKMDQYAAIPYNNARLEYVMKRVLQPGAERLLWMPPSRPYYELQGAFRGSEGQSKTLIFSSWEMVPRMLACMISYEAENRTVGKLAKERDDRSVHYFYTGEKRYPSARMNFRLREGEAASLTLFSLLYPSRFLSECYDPIRCMNDGLSVQDIQRSVRQKIGEKLKDFPNIDEGAPDATWYYLAPMLLDGAEYARNWLESGEQLSRYNDDDEKGRSQKIFLTHMRTLQDLFREACDSQCSSLGKRPADLTDVLVDMAIASPAVCINRTYMHYLGEGEALPSYLPGQLARVFLNRMNRPEATAIVELACGRRSDDAHWQNLLTYCRHGNLQAVFDEYAHLITCGIDRDKSLVFQMHERMMEAMAIRTTPYSVDTFQNFESRMNGNKEKQTNIRTHYAAAFTKGEGKDTDADRKKMVRNAFNSPFWPFVLATTSIGQEGLDFHYYCRRIVHWNLPSNPIDLEQREGRINRFECLAIRQNVAKRYGNIIFKTDVWAEMFSKAKETEKTDGASDLIPYWGLKETEDMVKIERIVPIYPFSRDGLSYERLIKILSMYRLTLGQARQEELLEYLFKNCDDPKKLRELFINLSPYYRKHNQ